MLFAESGKPQGRLAAITRMMTAHGLGVTRACGLIGKSHSPYHYKAKRLGYEALKSRLTALVNQKRRYGYRRPYVPLCCEGWATIGSARTGCIAKLAWPVDVRPKLTPEGAA